MKTQAKILFLHGALGSSAELLPLCKLMEEEGFETFNLNFSGHGINSTQPEEFRIDFFANELEQFLTTHKLNNVIVFGHSMGGYVALYHKAHFENSPLSMIFTYGTKFNWSESSVSKEIQFLDPENIQEKVPHFAKMLAEKHGDRWKQLLRSTAHMMQNLEKLDGLTKEDLEDVTIPVYLLLGDQDHMVTVEETNLTSKWLIASQVKIISSSKHEIEKANTKEISEIMRNAINHGLH